MVRSLETQTSTVECLKSGDRKHCYHTIANPVVYIQGGMPNTTEVCCWCGATREYIIEPSFSITMDAGIHGPFKTMYHLEGDKSEILR